MAVQRLLVQCLQIQGDAQQALPLQQGAVPLDPVHWLEVIGHQAECAAGQALAVLVAAHLIDQVQGHKTEQRHQHQGRQHAAIDAQED